MGTRGKYDHPFIARGGKSFTTIHKVWNRLRTEAGLPHLRLYDLRHQYASFLINQGRTLYEVQQILGHSDPTVMQRYTHLSTKSLQAAADSASDAISGAMPEFPDAATRHPSAAHPGPQMPPALIVPMGDIFNVPYACSGRATCKGSRTNELRVCARKRSFRGF